MKKIKLLMPLGIATLAGAMMPLVSCGCKDKDDVYYINNRNAQNTRLQSKMFNTKVGDELKFSFKWSDAKSLTPPAEDNIGGWNVGCSNWVDHEHEDLFRVDMEPPLDFTLTLDGKTLVYKPDLTGDYSTFYGCIAPSKLLGLKDNSVIAGTWKITKIVKIPAGTLEEVPVDEANNVFFGLVGSTY